MRNKTSQKYCEQENIVITDLPINRSIVTNQRQSGFRSQIIWFHILQYSPPYLQRQKNEKEERHTSIADQAIPSA